MSTDIVWCDCTDCMYNDYHDCLFGSVDIDEHGMCASFEIDPEEAKANMAVDMYKEGK